MKKINDFLPVIALALLLIGGHSQASTGFCDGDCSKEIHLFKVYAKQDSALAHMSLSHVYIMGNGVEVDIDRGVRHLRKAVALDFDPAYYQLGYFYYHGMYVEQDLEQAKIWLTKAAKGHIRNAKALLARMDNVGSGEQLKAELKAEQAQKNARRASQPKVERIKITPSNTYNDVISSIRFLAGERGASARAAGAIPYVLNRR
ncbi:MAG: TPR repeat protein [Alteromonadaceae bacterium]|jgi:TPR repeat protein